MAFCIVPSFNKNAANKINVCIGVVSEHVLLHHGPFGTHPAIAARGFPSDRDGTYVFVTHIGEIINDAPVITIGFTSTATHDSTKQGFPGFGMNGIGLYLEKGTIWGGNGVDDKFWYQPYLNGMITRRAKEIISILTISNNGTKKFVQFIVDGNEGPVHECDKKHFENGGEEIFPVVTL